jgi:hypothetical protein
MTRALVAAGLAAAALAAPAAAKGPVDVVICGAAECREFRWAPHETETSDANADLAIELVNLGQSFAFAETPELAPFYRVQLEVPGMTFAPLTIVPSARVAARSASWVRLNGRTLATFRRVASGIEPFPAPEIDRATVNGRPVDSPASYEAVFETLDEASAPPAGTPHAEIRFRASDPNPWTDGRGPVTYYPTADTLRRSGEWVRASPELVKLIEDDLVSVRKEESGLSMPAMASSVALVFGLVAVGWMTLMRRRASQRRG